MIHTAVLPHEHLWRRLVFISRQHRRLVLPVTLQLQISTEPEACSHRRVTLLFWSLWKVECSKSPHPYVHSYTCSAIAMLRKFSVVFEGCASPLEVRSDRIFPHALLLIHVIGGEDRRFLFVSCSATIAHPKEHVKNLVGIHVEPFLVFTLRRLNLSIFLGNRSSHGRRCSFGEERFSGLESSLHRPPRYQESGTPQRDL
jgi:hypothetical protein